MGTKPAAIGVVNITHDNSISLLWEPAFFPVVYLRELPSALIRH
jgi:hypothetical protein